MAKGKKESVESNKGETNLAFEIEEENPKNVKFKSKDNSNKSDFNQDFKRKSSKKKKSKQNIIEKVENNEIFEEEDFNKSNLKRHSALKLEKSVISKVQKHIFCNFKNGKKSIFAPEKSLKLPKLQFLN